MIALYKREVFMKVTILGSGTSTGVPVIGCKCNICTSDNIKNKRTRASLLISANTKNILIDTSTDLRYQALTHKIEHIDAVLFTHPHADHIHGIDELRTFNMVQEGPIPCYGNGHTIERIKVMFDYIFSNEEAESWRPNLTTTVIESPFSLFGTEVIPIDVFHGASSILGYRIGNAAYITDCSRLPDESLGKLRGLDVLMLGALRHKPHPTHLSISQAVGVVEVLKPGRAVLTHLSHSLDYRT